ncbi:MAG: hypothetical protein Q9208_005936 [Pyrenodesmia sp. 3 TL-2023]
MLRTVFEEVIFPLIRLWLRIIRFFHRLYNRAPSHNPASPTSPSPFFSLIDARLNPPRIPTASFAGHTVLIVGGTSGIGFEAALKFVSLDASLVVLTCRNPLHGMKARKQIELRTGRKSVCEYMLLNLISFESILHFTNQLSEEVHKLDVVLMHAGVAHQRHRVCDGGWEETLQVNVLGTALLAMFLLPHLQRGPDAPLGRPKHLCFVSSENYASAYQSIPRNALESTNLLEYFNKKEHFQGLEAQYNASKLLLKYVANGFALCFPADVGSGRDDSSVVINSVNPGVLVTHLTKNHKSIADWTMGLVHRNVVARTAEQGSRSLVSACLQGKETHGKLWQDDAIQTNDRLHQGTEGMKLQAKVWREVVTVLEKHHDQAKYFKSWLDWNDRGVAA